jgi:hypothetical protein
MRGEHRTIRMVRESVRMDIYPSYYAVDATFLFRNEGPATTVMMGFPESGSGDIRAEDYKRKTGFLRFATWVEGKQTPAQREPAELHEMHYKAYWVKQVAFSRGQQRTVRVQYRSRAGEVSNGERFGGYSFTGGNWKGAVDESSLMADLHLPGTWLVWQYKPTLERQGNRFILTRRNWQAEGSVSVTYMSTLPGWMALDGTLAWRPPGKVATLTEPGDVRVLDWAPPAVLRGGVPFVQLAALKGYLDRQAERARRSARAAISWDTRTKETSLTVGGRILSFRRGRAEMLVGNGKTIALPAATFVSPSAPYHPKGALYVPLTPVVEALGGTARVDPANHVVHLDLPPAGPAKSGR